LREIAVLMMTSKSSTDDNIDLITVVTVLANIECVCTAYQFTSGWHSNHNRSERCLL